MNEFRVRDDECVVLIGPMFAGREAYANILAEDYGFEIPQVISMRPPVTGGEFGRKMPIDMFLPRLEEKMIFANWEAFDGAYGYYIWDVVDRKTPAVFYGTTRSAMDIERFCNIKVSRLFVDPTVGVLIENIKRRIPECSDPFKYISGQKDCLMSVMDRGKDAIMPGFSYPAC